MISSDSKFYGNPTFGKNRFFGSNVIIGYPNQIKLKLAIEENKTINQLELSKVTIGSNCVFRDGSIVYEGVKISNNLRSGHYFQIRENTVIGENCIIGTKVIIEHNVEIGDNVCLQSSSFICPNAKIGNNVTTGPNVTFLDNKYLDYSLSPSAGPIIEENVKIGGAVTILPGIRVGSNSVIGAGSVVTKDVPPDSIYVGNPAILLRKIEK